jgi:hypothetical protein
LSFSPVSTRTNGRSSLLPGRRGGGGSEESSSTKSGAIPSESQGARTAGSHIILAERKWENPENLNYQDSLSDASDVMRETRITGNININVNF